MIAVVLANAQTPTYVWAKSMGSTSSDHGKSIAVDASGNVYTTGHFRGTVDFDPDPAKQKKYNLSSAGDSDVFISKLDVSGNFVWAKRLGGTTADVGQSIAVDASGNVYITGYFTGTVDFDPGSGSYDLTSSGIKDNFILKLSASGNFVWANRMGGIQSYFGPRLIFDANNIFVTGSFTGTSDFGSTTLTSAGGYDIFISKLNSSGGFEWTKQMGGELGDATRAIALDGSDNIYISGTSTGNLFISKLNTSGEVLWFKQMMGAGGDYAGSTSLKVDAEGNVYTTGGLIGTVDFDPDATATSYLTSAGQNDIFILKLDKDGYFKWVKSMGSTNPDGGASLALDASGNSYTTGWFSGTVDFNPGSGTANLTSNGWLDVFLLKLDKDGNFVLALNVGGINSNIGNNYTIGWDLTLDADENIYATGAFSQTVDFNPGNGKANLKSAGEFDIFILKLSQPSNGEPFKEEVTTGVKELSNSADFLLIPNPAKEQVTIRCNLASAKNAEIKLIDIAGQTIISELFTAKQGESNYILQLNGVSKGLYFVEFTTEAQERIVKKLMVE